METPTNFDGSYRCTRSGNTEYFEVSITNFAYTGPAGSTYGYGLALGSTIKDTGTSSTKTQTLNGSRSNDGQSTTWTFGDQAYLQQVVRRHRDHGHRLPGQRHEDRHLLSWRVPTGVPTPRPA